MQLSNYNNSWFDYCTCRRCPCCGKVIRQQPLTQIWCGAGGTTSSINDPKNAELKGYISSLIDDNKMVLS